jgi:hypothetical protein
MTEYQRIRRDVSRQPGAADPYLDTIVSIGVMGSGKSSFSNMLALQDNEKTIPVHEQVFPVGSGEKAKTSQVKV